MYLPYFVGVTLLVGAAGENPALHEGLLQLLSNERISATLQAFKNGELGKPLNEHRREQRQERAIATSSDFNKVTTPIPGHLEGTYVANCVYGRSIWIDPDNVTKPVPGLSVYQGVTVRYDSADNKGDNSSYELDRVEDLDFPCDSVNFKSELYSKWNLQGEIQFRGRSTSPKLNNTFRISRTVTSSTWLLPDPSQANNMELALQYLNAYCPCGIEWKTGVMLTVDAAKCTSVNETSGDLCQLIAGKPIYSLYKWVSILNPDERKFTESVPSFSTVYGWYAPTFQKYAVPVSHLAESGVHDPQDCNNAIDPVLVNNCLQLGVFNHGDHNIPNDCQGCQQLECTGCIWRYINNTKRDTYKDPYEAYTKCCPCMWLEAQIDPSFDWMKINC